MIVRTSDFSDYGQDVFKAPEDKPFPWMLAMVSFIGLYLLYRLVHEA